MAKLVSGSVEVRADGQRLQGLQSLTLDVGIDAVASRFSMSFASPPPLGDHSPLEVYLHDELRLTGFAEASVGGEDKDKDSYTVSGRSKTGDLVAGCVLHNTGEWLSQNLAHIAQAIVAPFGCRVVVRGDTSPSFTSFKVGDSEKAQAALRRLADNRGLILRDTPRGDLLISAPIWKESGYGLVRRTGTGQDDRNVLTSTVKRDNSKRHNIVIVRGQSEGWDLDATQIEGRAYDKNIKRHRPLVIAANKSVNQYDAQRLAEWEQARRLGQSLTWRGRVRGWRQKEVGPLWDVGYLVPVLDEKYNVHGKLLVTGVSFSLTTARGATTELTLQPPEAFLPKPVVSETGGATDPWQKLAAEVDKANVD